MSVPNVTVPRHPTEEMATHGAHKIPLDPTAADLPRIARKVWEAMVEEGLKRGTAQLPKEKPSGSEGKRVYADMEALAAAIGRPCVQGPLQRGTESGQPYIEFTRYCEDRRKAEYDVLHEIKRQISMCQGPTRAVVRDLPRSFPSEEKPGYFIACARIAFEPFSEGEAP